MKKLFIALVFGVFSMTLNAQSHLIFTYDASGNQIERKFVEDPLSAKQLSEISSTVDKTVIDALEEETLSDLITVYPNPTQGVLKLEWKASLAKRIQRITVSQLSGVSWEVPLKANTSTFVEIDLTNNANGVYVVNFELGEDQVVAKKIIKN